MHNLGTVIKFEVMRILKKPSFWLMALGFPILMAGIFAIVFWSNDAWLFEGVAPLLTHTHQNILSIHDTEYA